MLTYKQYVVNMHKNQYFDVNIQRGTKWGNPFRTSEDLTLEEVLEKYKNYILGNKELYDAIVPELKGKFLGCTCSPKKCHGHILSKIANR